MCIYVIYVREKVFFLIKEDKEEKKNRSKINTFKILFCRHLKRILFFKKKSQLGNGYSGIKKIIE